MDSQALRKWAEIILDYSLEVEKEKILYITSSYLAEPLIAEVYVGALKRGAYPVIQVGLPGFDYLFYKHANEKQLAFVAPWYKEIFKSISHYLNISATKNSRSLANVEPEKLRISNLASREIMEIFEEREAKGELNWCTTLYPTDSYAQEAEMSTREFEDFVIKACHLDEEDPLSYWRSVHERQEKLVKFLESKGEFRIVSEGTDLIVKTSGRKWINASGKRNFPDGEVFTSPVESGISGHIKFNMPQYYMGKEVHGAYLEFEDGLVKRADAEKGKEFLESVINTDEGSKRVGEFAFGLNYGIQRITKNILFDEKIGGTIHLALGRGFEEAGGQNKSVVHWDMILDLRKCGEIYADGQLIYRDGHFLIEL